MTADDNRLQLVSGGLMTVSQVGEFLNVSRSTVYGLMAQGALSFVKIGRARRIPRHAVLEFATAHLSGALMGVGRDRR